jgi:type I restriction enzyme R subunit
LFFVKLSIFTIVCKITDGRIQVGGGRKNPLIADYILIYKGIKLAVVEAKSSDLVVGEGVVQAKLLFSNLYTKSRSSQENITIISA